MSLPPGFLDELRDRVSLADVVGRKVIWDNRKSQPGKGDHWAPCPFHQEKTASFHVDDRKGYYYCFGCHAKGDAITFVRETENLSFMEAVERLASDAGMEMPAPDPAAKRKQDERSRQREIVAKALGHFRIGLRSAAGADARAYLERRRLGPEAWDRWELGHAADSWDGLRSALQAAGISDEDAIALGLLKASDRGRPYDVFRGRVIFPIHDPQGRPIAFGGRILNSDTETAKYINSPLTPLFDKGRTLFNHARARAAAGRGTPVIVAEGYMDVIALCEAGFEATVAPLGTAVTEEQLAVLWRMSPEPVIALDGDRAGLAAAERMLAMALPQLGPERSLRFALMPPKQDPDDVIGNGGRQAMDDLIAAAASALDILWRRHTAGGIFDSPERKAAVERDLKAEIDRIQDPGLRRHYERDLRDRLWELFRPPRRDGGTPRRQAAGAAPVSVPPPSLRERVVIAALLSTPAALPVVESALEAVAFADDRMAALKAACLRIGPENLSQRIEAEIGADALESLSRDPNIAVNPAVRAPGDLEVATQCILGELAKLAAGRGHSTQIVEAIEDLSLGSQDQSIVARLAQARATLDRATRQDRQDTTEFVTENNGHPLPRDQKRALADLLSQDVNPGRHNRR